MDSKERMKSLFQSLNDLLENTKDNNEMKLWKARNIIGRDEEIQSLISTIWKLPSYQDQVPFDSQNYINSDLKVLLAAIKTEYF